MAASDPNPSWWTEPGPLRARAFALSDQQRAETRPFIDKQVMTMRCMLKMGEDPAVVQSRMYTACMDGEGDEEMTRETLATVISVAFLMLARQPPQRDDTYLAALRRGEKP